MTTIIEDEFIASLMYSDTYGDTYGDIHENTHDDKLSLNNLEMIKDIMDKLTDNLQSKPLNQPDQLDQSNQSDQPDQQENQFALTKNEQKEFIAGLYDKMETEILPMHVSSFSMKLVVNINGVSVNCLIDTGAATNVISENLVAKTGLTHCVDKNATGKMVGVGEQKIVGFVPYFEIELDNVKYPICAMVANLNSSDEMIIGIPFLAFYQTTLDLKNRKVLINGKATNFTIVEH